MSTNKRIKLQAPSNEEEISMDSSMQYATWYEFKKEFERRLGYSMLNWNWLQVKPQTPLPWNDSHMKAALSATARLGKHEAGVTLINKPYVTASQNVRLWNC